MAVRIVVAVRDNAVEAFGQPFFVPHVGAAMRSFVDECQTPDSPPAKHPADYDLYRLGTFDDESGLFAPVDPELVMRGVNAKEIK